MVPYCSMILSTHNFIDNHLVCPGFRNWWSGMSKKAGNSLKAFDRSGETLKFVHTFRHKSCSDCGSCKHAWEAHKRIICQGHFTGMIHG